MFARDPRTFEKVKDLSLWGEDCAYLRIDEEYSLLFDRRIGQEVDILTQRNIRNKIKLYQIGIRAFSCVTWVPDRFFTTAQSSTKQKRRTFAIASRGLKDIGPKITIIRFNDDMSGLVEGKREVILDFRKNPNSKELLDKL